MDMPRETQKDSFSTREMGHDTFSNQIDHINSKGSTDKSCMLQTVMHIYRDMEKIGDVIRVLSTGRTRSDWLVNTT